MKSALRILLVEDSADDAQLLLGALEKSGTLIEHVRVDTPQALSEALREGAWDAVIVDYHLKRFSGFAAIEIVSESEADLPIFLVTSQIAEETAIEAMRAGVHDCIMKDKLARLWPAMKRELAEAEVRRERREASEQVLQLNLLLNSIRKINQLIVTESDRDQLLQRACECLIETRGYHSAWISLRDCDRLAARALKHKAEVKEQATFDVAQEQLCFCCNRALESESVIAISNVLEECGSCPVKHLYHGFGALSSRIEHAGEVFGVLTVSVDRARVSHQEEIALFQEVTRDLGLALHALEQEERKLHAEMELRDSEEKYRRLAEGTRAIPWEADAEFNVCTYVGGYIEELLGYTRASWLEPGAFSERLHPDDRDRVRAETQAANARGQSYTIEYRMVAANGQVIWLRNIVTLILSKDQSLLAVGNAYDIGEHKQSEAALAASEAQFRRLFETAKDSILVVDALTGQVVDANPATLQLLGLLPAEVINQQLWELGLFADIASSKASFRQMQTAEHFHFEDAPIKTKAGQILYVELVSNTYWVNGKQVIQCNIRDITARKLAEDALQASEERFRTVVESSSDALIAIGRNGLINIFNPAAESMFGLQAEHVINQPPDILMPQGFRIEHAGIVASYFATGQPNKAIGKTVELQAQRADGTLFPIDLSLSKGRGGNEDLVLAMIRDITERKLAEEALLSSETKFRTLFESSNDAVMLFHEDAIFECNTATLRMFGVDDKADFCSKHPHEISPAVQTCGTDSLTLANSYIAQAMHLGSSRFEWIHRKLDTNKDFPAEVLLNAMELDGRRVLQAVVRDITSRKATEAALQESARLLQLVVDTTPVRVFWKDRNLNYLGCNVLFAQDADLAGPKEIVGKSDYQLAWSADAEAYRSDDQAVIESGIPKIGFEERQLMEDGTTKWLLTSKIPLRDADGHIMGVLGCYDDITETREAQEELKLSHKDLLDTHEKLKQQQQQLIHSEKLASLGQLAAGVAHEINNPIAFIKSNLGTLQEYLNVFKAAIDTNQTLACAIEAGDADAVVAARQRLEQLEAEENLTYILEDVDEMIKESIGGSERVRDIVQDLRNFAHAGKETPVEADLNQIIRSSLRIVGNELKYKCEVVEDLQPVPMLRCYPERLNQVFVNLLVNAAQAIKDQGTIKVSTQVLDDSIVIRLADSGQGIEPEVLNKIFDPFFTTKEVGKGTGLGLAISHTTIQNHGGTIDVQSVIGQSTEFIVHLPLTGVSDE